MNKYFIFLICFIFSLSVGADENSEMIEQGSTSYYFSATDKGLMNPGNPVKGFLSLNDPIMAGPLIRAITKCYFTQTDGTVRCPEYVIGQATMLKATPLITICSAAKRAAVAPRGCQRRNCTLCKYESI